MEEKSVTIDMTALVGVEVSAGMEMLSIAFKDTPSETLSPVIAKLHAAWPDQPERILAFFLRDNHDLAHKAEHLLGLDVLDWSESMKEAALAEDSFAKMIVLSLADLTMSDETTSAFLSALSDKRYGMALWAVVTSPEVIAAELGEDWTTHYLSIIAVDDMRARLVAKTLAGAIADNAPEHFQSGLQALDKAEGDPDLAERALADGRYFAAHPSAAFDALIASHWDDYAAEAE